MTTLFDPVTFTATWYPRSPRHGRVDWHDLSPVEAMTMLATMEAASACPVPPGERWTTWRGVVRVFRAKYVGPGQWPYRIPERPPLIEVADHQLSAALCCLARRGALTIDGALASADHRITPAAWPYPGGAPW